MTGLSCSNSETLLHELMQISLSTIDHGLCQAYKGVVRCDIRMTHHQDGETLPHIATDQIGERRRFTGAWWANNKCLLTAEPMCNRKPLVRMRFEIAKLPADHFPPTFDRNQAEGLRTKFRHRLFEISGRAVAS